MPTIEQVKAKVKNLDGGSQFLGKWEINELPNILWEDEDIIRLASGVYNNGMGIVVATNKRILFLNKGVFNTQIEDFSYNKISSIQCNKGVLMGSLIIYSAGNKAVIDSLTKPEAQYLADYIRARISQGDTQPQPQQVQQDNSQDVVSQLERLAKLKEQGVLTDEEFAQQKAKILGQ